MMKSLTKVMLAACLLMAGQAAFAASPWKKGAFETKKYRNLFVEMGYSKKDVDAKLQEVFNDCFYGPNKVYFEVPMYQISRTTMHVPKVCHTA